MAPPGLDAFLRPSVWIGVDDLEDLITIHLATMPCQLRPNVTTTQGPPEV